MPRFATFTPNPALDLSTSVGRLEDAHKLRCDAPLVHPGGGGINVARVLHRLGASVVALYPTGGATGERLHGLLRDEGVRGLRHPIAGETRESFTVHERETGREYRFVLPGPTVTADEWRMGLQRLQRLAAPPAWIVASGGLPPGAPVDGYAQVAQAARALGARMVLDSAGAPLSAALEAGVWLVKPSLRELAELTGQSLDSTSQRLQAARSLVERGQAQWVALSLGAEGAMLVGADQCLCAAAPAVTVAGSVGAGDSFLAALVWALDAQADPAQALATAMAAGSAAVMAQGTALCQPQDIERLRSQVRVQAC